MLLANPNVVVREGGFLEAMRYALDNKACFVMALVEIPEDQPIDTASEALLNSTLAELGLTSDEFNAKVLANTVQLNVGGYWPMSVEEYAGHINELATDHEAPSLVFVSDPMMVKALVPGVTLQ